MGITVNLAGAAISGNVLITINRNGTATIQ